MSTANICQFILATLLPVAATIMLFLLKRDTRFGSMSNWKQQVVIGVVFGTIAILGTEFGIDTKDATMNVRDAAPLTAGLVFGPQAGVIAGFMGGIERWFAALWGRGVFTRIGCSLGTIGAGLFAAYLNKHIFDGKTPNVALSYLIGSVVEVCHLMLVFVTNMDEAERALMVVSACTIPMVLCNSLSIMMAVLAYKLLSKEPPFLAKGQKPISRIVQSNMLVITILAFLACTGFSYLLQTSAMQEQTTKVFKLNLNDAVELIRSRPEDLREITSWRVGESGLVMAVDDQGKLISSIASVDGKSLDYLDLTEWETRPADELFTQRYLGVDMYVMLSRYEGYTVVAMLPRAEAEFTRDSSVLVSSFMITLVFAALFTGIYSTIKRSVVDNVHEVNESLAKITAGDLNVKVDVGGNREFNELSEDINETVDALKDAIAEASARIDKELEYARTIQRNALPMVFPPYPARHDFEIFASMDAAKEVGGDFYDFYLVDDEHLAFVIADVSDKGIPAALFMMSAKMTLKSLATSGLPVNEVFKRANNYLCEGNETEMFVTCWMGVLDLTTGQVTYANAGHNPPALAHAGDSFEYVVTNRPNMVLAGMEGIPYRLYTLDLVPGDTLFLYTDGVTEASDEVLAMFGEDRLKASLDANGALDVESLCKRVRVDVDAFVGGAPQFDDMTMLALRYMGKE